MSLNLTQAIGGDGSANLHLHPVDLKQSSILDPHPSGEWSLRVIPLPGSGFRQKPVDAWFKDP
jgi:hypothetical protein